MCNSHRQIAHLLAWLGIVPMLVAGLAFPHPAAATLLTSYTLAIAAFVCGNAWTAALMNRSATTRQRVGVLLGSNLLVLCSVGAAIMAPAPAAFLVFAIVFALLLAGDLHCSVLSPQPAYYRRMRVYVSTVVIAVQLTATLRASL